MVWKLSTLAKQPVTHSARQHASEGSPPNTQRAASAIKHEPTIARGLVVRDAGKPDCKQDSSFKAVRTPKIPIVIEGVYNVEKILDKRPIKGQQCYLVKWEYFEDPKDRTWEYCKSLAIDVPDIVAAYESERLLGFKKRTETMRRRKGKKP